MAVELDVFNRDSSLSPGMYPSVKWPIRRSRSCLVVPKTSVVTTTERTFVIRNRSGHAEWVNVSKGTADGDLVEVSGSLQAGDMVFAGGRTKSGKVRCFSDHRSRRRRSTVLAAR